MDPLSDGLSLLKPQSYVTGGFGVDGEMAIRFPKHRGIKCYAMVSGECWLSVEGVPEAVLLDPRPGGSLIAQQLAHMLLIQALRLHLADGGVGWLFALADKQMSAAIACMHDDPGHAWTLQELAERVGMSRSIFALRFKETVGATAMEYLTRWRMLLARERLKGTDDSICAIASSLGYESESAFGKAFRRVMGCSPRQYSRGGGGAAAHSLKAEDDRFEGQMELVGQD